MKNNFNNDDAKEQIRSRANIADIIGRHVTLKGRGQTLMGLCPFHKEKSPSFTVNPIRGFYHCFGCGKGGDVFNFVMEMEGVDFREALEILAEETNVTLENRSSRDKRDYYDDRSPPPWLDDEAAQGSRHPQAPAPSTPSQTKTMKLDLLSIHDEVATFFYERIKGNRLPIDYFESRGLSAKTVKEFRLGYASAGWSELYDYMKSKNVPLSKMVECGLVVSKDSGSIYDRFRNRIIFPLYDLNGRVIAFAGRGLDKDTQPKYLNSPETLLYKKSGVLYGIHKSRQSVRDAGYMLIVEGYMDYLTLYQAGICNAAAVSGTAFTEGHANIIRRFTQKVILVFDSDRAGLSAAQRAAFVLAPFRLEVRILTLPAGDDPDTFVKREGAEAFLAMLSTAKPAADFLIDKLMSEHDGSALGKSRVVDELAPYARALTDDIVRADFLTAVAQRLRVDRQLVADRFGKSVVLGPPADDFYGDDDGGAGGSPGVGGGRVVLGALEESFLRILLTEPDLVVRARQYISPEMFIDTPAANIYSIILEAYERDSALSGLHDVCYDDPEAGRLISMLANKPALLKNIDDELVQKILMLRRKFLKARIGDLKVELQSSPESEKGRLLEDIRDYGEQLRDLDLQG